MIDYDVVLVVGFVFGVVYVLAIAVMFFKNRGDR